MFSLLLLIGCARVDIPAIGLSEDVVKGDQTEIDQGYVVDYLPYKGSGAGVWLAGHRTTHGGVFRNLPDIQVGDQVCVYSNCYNVVRKIFYGSRNFPGYLGRVVLQTSLPGGALLVVAE